MRRWIAVLSLCAVACSSAAPLEPAGVPSPSVSPAPSPREDARAEESPWPGYRDRLPRRPEALTALAIAFYRRLPRDIDSWLKAGGGLRRAVSDTVRKGALAQQRVFRLLARKSGLYARVYRRLPRRIARIV